MSVGRGSRAGKGEFRQFKVGGNSRHGCDVGIERELEPVLYVSLRDASRRQGSKSEIVKLIHVFTLPLPTEARDKANVNRITPCFVIQVTNDSVHQVGIGVQ